MGVRLSERAGFGAGPTPVVALLGAQRQRFLSRIADLPSDRWTDPTRCTEWTVHEVTRHVADAASVHAGVLHDRPAPFAPTGPFDPTRTPSQWLAASAGEAPVATVDRFAAAVEEEAAGMAARVRAGREDVGVGATGRPTHWTVLASHILFDAWLHERDVFPLLPPEADELVLLTAYALLLAAVPAASSGLTLDAVAVLDRPWRIRADADDIVVEEGDGPGPRVEGDALTVLEALLGRGPTVAAVLTGHPGTVEQLSWLRAFLAPGT